MSDVAAGFDQHPCLSALASCSGLSPCEPCQIALERWVMSPALVVGLAAIGCQDGGVQAELCKAFFATEAEARQKTLAGIREEAIRHEQRLTAAAARAASASAAPSPESVAAVAAQVEPVPVNPAAAARASEATIAELFTEAVSVRPPPPAGGEVQGAAPMQELPVTKSRKPRTKREKEESP